MNKMLCVVVVAMVGLFGLADDAPANQLPESEVAEIKKFFVDLKIACNSRDWERIEIMSGKEWKRFSRGKSRDIKIADIEIINLTSVTNVVTKVTESNLHGESYSAEIIFALQKIDGVYSIAKMRVPEDERRHDEFETANQNFKKLIAAIKSKDIGKAKDAFTFGDVADFDAELTARGLSWIEDAANSDVVISGGWGVNRSGKEGFVGHVEIANEPGGTNVLHEVIFKGLKIDRAAPPKETYEEFSKRFDAEQKAARKEFEEKWAAEQKKIEEQFWERVRKWKQDKQRNGAGAK